jgi:methionine-gamma-lyase
VLEKKLALLEGTEDCKFFGSGMAAIAAVIMEVCRDGGHVVAGKSLYNHTYKLLNDHVPAYGINTTFVDMTDMDEVEAAITSATRLLWLESPANPAMQLTDLRAASVLARERGILTAIDNSLATPFNQRPAEHGIDYVVHTATKYLNGHSDVVAGSVCASYERIDALLNRQHADIGGILGPFEAWLVLRGVRTLGVRMRAHNEAAKTIALWLADQTKVERVFYPTAELHPQPELLARQMSGGSGLVCFVLQGGEVSAEKFVNALKHFGIGVSWGGFESLALPMWRANSMPEEHRRSIGLVPGFVRLSIGLEDIGDLTADIGQALARA